MATSISQGPPGLGLHADLMAVEQDYPGWHVWLSDTGTVYATHVLSRIEQAALRVRSGGLTAAGGTTLSAATPDLMRHEIACHVERSLRVWAA